MFSMLSMLQKEGNAAQDTPSLRTQFAPNTAQANEAAPIDKLLEAVKIYIIALLRLEEIDF